MCQHVFLEVAVFCAFVFTLIAAELLFSSVNMNVLFQMSSVGGRVGTHGACVAFLSYLLYFGLGGERHCSKFSEKLAPNFL